MDNESKTNIKVGLTVLVGIAVLLLGLAWGKEWRPGGQDQTVRAIFKTAGGLEVGDPVTINGVKQGKVSAMQLRHSDVIVSMEFPKRVDLRQDARASIMMLEVMGGKKIELLSGSSPDRLAEGALIQGEFTGDIGSLVAMVGSLSETLQSIIGKADTLFSSLNTFFEGGDLRQQIDRTLSRADNALGSVDRVATRADVLLATNADRLQSTLVQAEAAMKDVNELIRENRPGIRAFIDSTNLTVSSAHATMRRADRLLNSLDTLVGSNRNRNGLLHKLANDPVYANKLDSVLNEFIKLSEHIRFQGLDANIRFFNSSEPVK